MFALGFLLWVLPLDSDDRAETALSLATFQTLHSFNLIQGEPTFSQPMEFSSLRVSTGVRSMSELVSESDRHGTESSEDVTVQEPQVYGPPVIRWLRI